MPRRSEFGSIDRPPSRTGKPGRWRARYKDADGKEHVARFDTKAESGQWLAAQRTDRTRGSWTDPRAGRESLAEWIGRYRLSCVGLRPSTQARDEGYINRYILPTLGKRQLSDIDYMAVRTWVADLSSRGLAPATVVKAKQILGKILQAAVDASMLAINPTANVPLPRVDHIEMMFLEPAQIVDLAEAIDPRYRALVVVGCYCGLRMGELLALTPADVDLLHRTITVERIITDVGGHLYFGPPKTERGRRSVPITRHVAAELSAMPPVAKGEQLWQSAAGGPVRLNNWRARYWRPAVQSARLDGFRPHDMRHTAVSLWMAHGAEDGQVARWAGHASVATVIDRYSHIMAGRNQAVMDAIDVTAGFAPSQVASVSQIAHTG